MVVINQEKRSSRINQELQEIKTKLEFDAQESAFFLKQLDHLKNTSLGDSHKSLLVAELVQEFHHFQRFIKRLLGELRDLQKDFKEDIVRDQAIDNETIGDIRYFKGEMEDFEKNYKEYKYRLRAFVASHK